MNSSKSQSFEDYVDNDELIMSIRDKIIDPDRLIEDIKRVLIETGLSEKTTDLTPEEISLIAKKINRTFVLKPY